MYATTIKPVSITFPRTNSYQDPVEIYENDFVLEKFLQHLLEFTTIKGDWDRNGAVAPSWETIQNAWYFILLTPHHALTYLDPENVYPTPYGTIILDFENSNKLLSIEIGKQNLGYFLEEDNKYIEMKEKEPFSRVGLSTELKQAFKSVFS